ncbi:YIP1 family protein [Pseudodonghicola xiamenensis]|uniref:Yip1 domain-containing protein n=1 Tax=Pseudodonghicola xiamenensis TaxID=337702 RepID=A0A8J3MDC8_9RHOB|nr:YIP1 family protein [Pseudodonghicola xiamenensis]GHG94969.1 hypothetical protein GCM10010961_28410 [Pseudodonghicola xiamenensis]
MNGNYWRDLVTLSLTDPAMAARQLMALNLRRDLLWTGLALTAVLNTLIYSLSGLLSGAAIFGAFGSPFFYLGIMAASLVLTILCFYLAGRMLGGQGRVEDLLVAVLWLQVLRMGVQVIVLILGTLSPALGVVAVFAAMFIGLFITVHFLNQVFHFNSLGRAAGTMILSIVIMTVLMILLLAIVGGTQPGGSFNV